MSARCRVMFTRVCPRSLPAECPDVCLRFEVDQDPPPPEVVAIWQEHVNMEDAIRGWYVLDGKTPIPATLRRADKLLQDVEKRRVAEDLINGRYRVSTVFLGLDHSFGGPLPILFETMIFDMNDQRDVADLAKVAGDLLGEEIPWPGSRKYHEALDYSDRYATWEEAEQGHRQALVWLTWRLEHPDEDHPDTVTE